MEKVYQGKIFDLTKHADGSETVDYASEGAVVIIATDLTNSKIIMIRQFRTGLNRVVQDLPAGKMEVGETPVSAAFREFKEETGFDLLSAEKIHQYHPTPALSNSTIHLFHGTYDSDKRGLQSLDDDERIEVLELSIDEFLKSDYSDIVHNLVAQYYLKRAF